MSVKNVPTIFLSIILLSLGLQGCGAVHPITHPDRKSITASRVHLVDHFPADQTTEEGRNFLFRGTDPVLRSEAFAYGELTELMRKAGAKHGFPLPKDFYLIDVSLLFLERADLSVEKRFFEQHPRKGEFVNYPVFGHVGGERFERIIHTADKGVEILRRFSSYPIFGALHNLFKGVERNERRLTQLDINAVTGIRGLLTQRRTKPTVVYVHCVAGCDRTGEIIGAYRMQYMKQGLQAVYKKNSRECRRKERLFSADALESYCRYLGKEKCDISERFWVG